MARPPGHTFSGQIVAEPGVAAENSCVPGGRNRGQQTPFVFVGEYYEKGITSAGALFVCNGLTLSSECPTTNESTSGADRQGDRLST